MRPLYNFNFVVIALNNHVRCLISTITPLIYMKLAEVEATSTERSRSGAAQTPLPMLCSIKVATLYRSISTRTHHGRSQD